MKKTRIILAMGINRQPSKGTQLNLICASRIDQAIHLRNENRQSIHRNILIPLSLATRLVVPQIETREEGQRIKLPYSTGISAWTLSRSIPSLLRADLNPK